MKALAITTLLAAVAYSQSAPKLAGPGGSIPDADGKTPLNRARVGPAGPVPHAKAGKPDLSGIWYAPRTVDPGEAAMLPWAAKLTKERTESHSQQDPEARCLPAGVPRTNPFPYKLVQTPTLLVMLYEGNIHSYRQIFIDGRAHPKDLEPTWYGDSIGKWDGDTLVVDTVGFNDKFWFDFQGHPHTEQLHVIEKYKRRDLGNLDIEVTIEDPGAYTKPWIMKRTSALMQNYEIQEYICNENNQDVEHLVGK